MLPVGNVFEQHLKDQLLLESPFLSLPNSIALWCRRPRNLSSPKLPHQDTSHCNILETTLVPDDNPASPVPPSMWLSFTEQLWELGWTSILLL